MAEYKDIDQILKTLPDDLSYKASVKRVLIQAPTADVVPKSEAEEYRKIAEYQQSVSMSRYFEIKRLKEKLAKAKQEVAKEIFEGLKEKQIIIVDRADNMRVVATSDDIAELMKKYIGAEKE